MEFEDGVYGLILTGGSGTRLWPRSREDLPKQFLALGGTRTLLQDTVARLTHLIPIQRMRAVTGAQWEALVAYQVREIAPLPEGFIIQEPCARGTAPAILLGVRALREAGAGEDDVVVVTPSDHIVQDPQAFTLALRQAAAAAREGFLTTLGVVPTHPETGFGYIKKGRAHSGWHEAEAFVEKPDRDTAERYLRSGDYLWNSGVFIFTPRALTAELSREPSLLATLERGADGFDGLPTVSFDVAVMERASRVAVVPLDAGWSDVGSWDALHDILDRDERGNAALGDVVLRDCGDCFVDSRGRLTVLSGVSGLVVVDSPDALFITRRGASQEVRDVVRELKGRGRKEVSRVSESTRPWGAYRVLCEGARHRVKRVVVMPGRAIPLQRNFHRSERWVVLSGAGRLTLDGRESFLHEGDCVLIPRDAPHALENCGQIDLTFIAVQEGEYLGEGAGA